MIIFALDPGTTHSAWVKYARGSFRDGPSRIIDFGYATNEKVLARVFDPGYCNVFVSEMIASYGMPVGAEVFETCVWIGRFIQAAESWGETARVYRKDVKLHLCGQPRAKDGNVRQAIIDRFGGKDRAIGKKKTPGPLYGISGDVWAALAVALTYADTIAKEK